MSRLYEVLLFPVRAENLEQFSAYDYDVDLAHWKGLSSIFQQTFQNVYERGASAILLVHGAQGTGKTLFSQRLQQDFEKASKGDHTPNRQNLWHTLVGDDPLKRETIERATTASDLRRVEPRLGWLEAERTFAKNDKKNRVRIFVIDDVHKDVFLREWAGLTQTEYLGMKTRKEEAGALGSVAERLVEDCRGDFKRSIFLLLSNDAAKMESLKQHIDQSHKGLATVRELPMPAPQTKEQIIRKNINRLNRVSYWFCLDAAEKGGRSKVYDVLMDESKGFTDSFTAVDDALKGSERRGGRPANRNVITLVTLGTSPAAAKDFIDSNELEADEHHLGDQLGIWLMREQWASELYQGSDAELSRRARMVESEFSLRWVTLDLKATHALCEPPQPSDLGERLLQVISFFPSIGKPDDIKKMGTDCKSLEGDLASKGASNEDVEALRKRFSELGQRRSVVYEAALTKRLHNYGRGFAVFGQVKPDFISGEYRPCSITEAKSNEPGAISEVLRRTCHAIESTAFLQSDMAGLDGYIFDKVSRYALLLEST